VKRGIGQLGLAAAVVVATATIHGQMPTRARAAQGELFVPRPELARATALGFDGVLADYYWLQAIQIVGGDALPEARADVLAALIDVVTTLDPRVDHPYRFAAVWLTDREESVRKANALLERGIGAHPHDWRNRFYLGFNHFFYLDEPNEAADALEGAIALPGAPLYLHRLVARLKSAEAGLEVAETFLRELLRGELNPHAQAQFEKALDEIATERLARVLDAARSAYRERHGRDIASLEDLASGPAPILRALPREPHGGGWVLDPTTGQIVSDVVGHRYEPKLDPVSRGRLERWRARSGTGEPRGTRPAEEAPRG
jgi:hypothetical protein